MDDYAIRLLSGDDLEGALHLSSTAGWNQRLEDWRMLVSLAPDASFAAIGQQRVIGTAIGIDYARFSWIAMMLVEPSWRGRGVGRRLLEAAMEAVPADRPIRLDATPLGRPLYQAHGFQDESLLTRHVSESDGRTTLSQLLDPPDVRPMTRARLHDIAEVDREIFRGTRRAVLEWSFDTAPEYCHYAVTDGQPQYCFGRRGRLFDQIGPVVAVHDHVACALVGAALARTANRAVAIDVFDRRTGFEDWLRACGFRAQRPLFRMQRPPVGGERTDGEARRSPATEFAIFGPEFA